MATLPSRPATDVQKDGPPATPVQIYALHGLKQTEATQFFEMCWVDQAHAVMLVRAGIIDDDDGQKLLEALVAIAQGGVNALPQDPTKESFLSYIETALENKVGKDLAAKLHTARSRIDQSATINLVVFRDASLGIMKKIIALQQALLQRAKDYPNSAMPYYTHMQQAQPGTFGHYLLAKVQTLNDDLWRCKEAFGRMNRNPLGGVGRSGTGWPTDRKITTKLLAFDGIVDNSLRCRDTDYAAEMAFTLSIVMSHLNDIAADFELWCMREIGYLTLPNEFCAVSSIFPQKKNPLTLDTLRHRAGAAVNWSSSALATYRCLGTGDQIVHGVPSELSGAITTTNEALDHMAKLTMALTFNEERASEVLAEGWATLSNLTDWLAQKNDVPFRIGYTIVKSLMAECTERNIRCSEITADMVTGKVKELAGREISITQADVDTALNPDEFIRTRISTGSIGPKEVHRMIDGCGAVIVENLNWVEEKCSQIQLAQKLLAVEVCAITHPDLFLK